MLDLSSVIQKVKAVAAFTPEHEGDNIGNDLKEPLERLVGSYPELKHFGKYVEFLKATGGAHIHNSAFSFGIYGFGGYVVPSFAEGSFLDKGHYFIFGEVLFAARPNTPYFLAFDLRSENDTVYISAEGRSEYAACSNSFLELLTDFVEGKDPGA